LLPKRRLRKFANRWEFEIDDIQFIFSIFLFMYRFRLTLLFLTIPLLSGYSQIKKITESLGISSKTVVEEIFDSVRISDSLKIALLSEQIQQFEQNELFFQEQLLAYERWRKADSLAFLQRREQIDSLRRVTKGMPVVLERDTLFSIYPVRGGNSYITRTNNTKNMIDLLGKDRSVKPDSINIFTLDGYREIMYGDRAILILSDDDALWMNMPLDSLANTYREKIVGEVKYLQYKNSLRHLIKRWVQFLAVLIALALFFRLLNYLSRRFKVYVRKQFLLKFTPVIVRNNQLLNLQQALNIVFFAINIVRYIFMLLALLIAIPILFFIFPQTRDLAETLFSYITTPVKSIFSSIIDYIPNLFTIVIIWLFVHYILKGIKYISNEIAGGRLKISGFYADWATPTFNLIRFFLYAFMIAMIYPYLPGSNTGIFQGVSVFIGLILSLGSTAVIGNIIAGLVITYMRPFKVGDMIKLSDTIGNVIEKTPFVTRIRTLKNEVITIPNSFMLSSQTTNYTASADNYGLIIHVAIGVSYSVPNTRVHELLIKAARMTEGVLSDREPFVLDKKFEDLYQQYEINAYIADANAIGRIYSKLHHNIQNTFIEAGVELQVPFVVSQTDTLQKKATADKR
jgi:small-conductance mechanosensitive channel